MSEIVAVFSSIIALASLLHQIWVRSDEKKKKHIEKFEAELDGFLNNVLGWYNQIVSFSRPLLEDIKEDKLSNEKLREYMKLLNTIKQSDVYYSKCRLFVSETLNDFKEISSLDEARTASLMRDFRFSYERFSDAIFAHKDKIGLLLTDWGSMSPSKRRWRIQEIISGLDYIEGYKDAVVRLFSVKLQE